jgi:glycosyltransferase involved in cell wall biosynthesis
MRVGIDARNAGPGLGIATFLRALVDGLVGTPGLEIVWFGPQTAAPAGVADVREPGPYPLLDSALGRRWARDARVDVFHFASNTGWWRPGPAPTVQTIHDLIYMDTGIGNRGLRQVFGHRYLRANVPRSAPRATRVVAPSQATADAIRDRLGVDATPTVIPQGIEVPEVTRPPEGEPPYVVAFSAQDPRKGVEHAIAGVRGSRSRPRLVLLAGAGVPSGFDRLAAPDLESGQLSVRGYLPREELWTVLAGAEALIYPSLAEGFGMPLVEAMAVGVPVITGLSPATAEVGGEAAIAIDPAAPGQSIAAALDRLRDDPAYRLQVIQRGYDRARDFDWTVTAQTYADLYAELAGA